MAGHELQATCKCGGKTFLVYCWVQGVKADPALWQYSCVKCGTVWATVEGRRGKDERSDEALGGARDVA